MSGIYGEILLAFPEQMQSVTIYNMTAKENGAWEAVLGSSLTIQGIIQHTAGRRIQDSNGNLVQTSGLELWTTSPADITGQFLTFENTVYRITSDNKWIAEGGYKKYALEKVVGNNGTEPNNTTWNLGSNNFG